MGLEIVSINRSDRRLAVARRAVVLEVARMSDQANPNWNEAYRAMSERWLSFLHAADDMLPYAASTKAGMSQCKPEGASTEPKTIYTCSNNRVCPWCWMRRTVNEIFGSVEYAVAELESGQHSDGREVHLIQLRAERPVDAWKNGLEQASAIEGDLYRPYIDSIAARVIGRIKLWRPSLDDSGSPVVITRTLIAIVGHVPRPRTDLHIAESVT